MWLLNRSTIWFIEYPPLLLKLRDPTARPGKLRHEPPHLDIPCPVLDHPAPQPLNIGQAPLKRVARQGHRFDMALQFINKLIHCALPL
jgi:hypothetical protein